MFTEISQLNRVQVRHVLLKQRINYIHANTALCIPKNGDKKCPSFLLTRTVQKYRKNRNNFYLTERLSTIENGLAIAKEQLQLLTSAWDSYEDHGHLNAEYMITVWKCLVTALNACVIPAFWRAGQTQSVTHHKHTRSAVNANMQGHTLRVISAYSGIG